MSNQCGSTSSILSNRKRKAAEKELSIVLSKKARFYSTFLRQFFSLPNYIIYYILMNPKSSAFFQKLIKTCKYFFAKNPLLIIQSLWYSNDQWEIYNKAFSFKNLTCKVWITEELFMDLYEAKCAPRSILSSIVPQIFRCDVQHLTIINQDIALNDLSLLLSSAEYIAFDDVIVKDENNSIVGIENIVEVAAAKNAKSFTIVKPTITPLTMIKLKKISFPPKFDNFSMKDIPETFDLEAFSVFMKKNKTIFFALEFDPSISDSYKTKLEAIINEILSTKVLTFKPPKLYFYGINDEKHQKLCGYFYQPLKNDKNAAVCYL
uniref:Uncharacterized protein n=1 Tax=Panagrolaimus sp. PS1159 TaxID=55785 RepID=A0AC35GI74_9BILA